MVLILRDKGTISGRASRSRKVSRGVDDTGFEAKGPSGKASNVAGKTRVTNMKLKTRAKNAENGVAKKHSKYSSWHSIRKQDERAEAAPKSSRKRHQVKPNADDNPNLEDDKPKRRKRVIRIDPYDISNKRLDDGIVVHG